MSINVLRDASNNVVRASFESLTPTSGTVLVEGVTDYPAEFLVPGVRAPGSLFDDEGRCVWRVDGAAIVPGAPRWPDPAAFKAAAVATLRRRIDDALLDILALERWQSVPANTDVYDRSDELSAARARLVRLRDILASS